MNPINLKKFTWVKESNTLVSTASDLMFPPGKVPGAQIFPDSCDYGIALESPKTGKIVRYIFERVDEMAFYFKAYTKDNSPVKDLVIYND